MSDPRHTRASELFLAVCDLAPELRTDRLRAECGDDPELCALVEGMLAAGAGAARAFDRPAAARYLPLGDAEAVRQVGPFTLLGRLGRGGMGVVYEAQQEHPARRVALKLVPSIFASAEVLRRFEQEANVLGGLNHPGIAQIYEAGVADSPEGPQPWFAMELVRGPTLTEFAEERGLGLRERLALLEEVCRAVQHAHQQGVVHRDLKPSNILVDPESRPKVLDFGIARAVDVDPEAFFATRTGELLGTVSYMSPEQMEADPARLDTRTDVYSLGVLGYELVTGRLPHDLGRVPLSEAIRVLRDEEPAAPSKLVHKIPGDVDTILLVALAKEKADRYPSARALADDLQRFLADEPIAARPPSTLYQIRKFTRRHRSLVTAAAAVFVILVAATVFSTVAALGEARAARRAEERRLEAERQTAIASAVNEFLNDDLLAAVRPEAQGRDVTMLQVLEAAAANVEARFADEPVVEAEIRTTIGNTYLALGRDDLAAPFFLRALELRKAALEPRDEKTIESENGVGRVMTSLGRLDEAERHYTRCLELRREVLGPEAEPTLTAQNNLAGLVRQRGREEEALGLSVEAAEIAERMLGPEHDVFLSALEGQAGAYKDLGRPEDAIPLYEQVLDTRRRVGSPERDITRCTNNLAVAQRMAGRPDVARELFAQAYEGSRELLGEDHPETIVNLVNLARATAMLGDFEQAEPMFERALLLNREVNGPDHRGTLITMYSIADMYRSQGRVDEAEAMLLELHALSLARYGPDFPVTATAADSLVALYESSGRADLAQEWRVEAAGDARGR